MINFFIKNDFCIISKKANKFGWHDIQTNSSWTSNPHEEEYAIIPNHLVQEILKTYGYCDLELNEDETEVISFTAREIPPFPDPEPIISETELQWQAITDLEISYMELENKLLNLK